MVFAASAEAYSAWLREAKIPPQGGVGPIRCQRLGVASKKVMSTVLPFSDVGDDIQVFALFPIYQFVCFMAADAVHKVRYPIWEGLWAEDRVALERFCQHDQSQRAIKDAMYRACITLAPIPGSFLVQTFLLHFMYLLLPHDTHQIPHPPFPFSSLTSSLVFLSRACGITHRYGELLTPLHSFASPSFLPVLIHSHSSSFDAGVLRHLSIECFFSHPSSLTRPSGPFRLRLRRRSF